MDAPVSLFTAKLTSSTTTLISRLIALPNWAQPFSEYYMIMVVSSVLLVGTSSTNRDNSRMQDTMGSR